MAAQAAQARGRAGARRLPTSAGGARVGGRAEARATRRGEPIEEERPPAPWGSFPLVEIVVLVALVMLIGWLVVGGERGRRCSRPGSCSARCAGLELSIREHFGGYRSHTVMLAAAAGVATLALVFYVLPDLLSPTLRLDRRRRGRRSGPRRSRDRLSGTLRAGVQAALTSAAMLARFRQIMDGPASAASC